MFHVKDFDYVHNFETDLIRDSGISLPLDVCFIDDNIEEKAFCNMYIRIHCCAEEILRYTYDLNLYN